MSYLGKKLKQCLFFLVMFNTIYIFENVGYKQHELKNLLSYVKFCRFSSIALQNNQNLSV